MSAEKLTEFLLARIAEDEELAREATPGPWWNESGIVHAPSWRPGATLGAACHPAATNTGNGIDDEADADHIARWDPARVLAECEAKRLVVTLHDQSYRDGTCTVCEPRQAPCQTIKMLALPYADHPDYQREWQL